MRVVTSSQIRGALDANAAVAAIREGLIAGSQGRVNLGAVGHLAFPRSGGECHVKSASMAGIDMFAVKIATSFAANPGHSLSTNNGMIALIDARNGLPLYLLQDEAYLTDVRTALVSAIATQLICPTAASTLGIIGTGVQACLQAKYVTQLTGLQHVILWGRNIGKAQAAAASIRTPGLTVEVVTSVGEVCESADVIITATTASAPLITYGMHKPGMRIIAVGADAPGKQEIDPRLIARMNWLIVDSFEQCLDHGDLSHPFKNNLIGRDRVIELGTVLAQGMKLPAEASVLVDLTGLGIHDLQIARSLIQTLEQNGQDDVPTAPM